MLDEADPEKCPKCGTGDIRRLLSTFRISGARPKSARKEDELPGPDGADPMAGLDGMGDMGGMGGGMDGMEGMGEDGFDGDTTGESAGTEEEGKP